MEAKSTSIMDSNEPVSSDVRFGTYLVQYGASVVQANAVNPHLDSC